jgi:hypothetical protein
MPMPGYSWDKFVVCPAETDLHITFKEKMKDVQSLETFCIF